MDAVGLRMTRRDCTAECTRTYGRSIHRTMSTALTFVAPAIGTWDVSASAFGEAFESGLVHQREARTLEESMDAGWRLLRDLPRGELTRLSDAQIDARLGQPA